MAKSTLNLASRTAVLIRGTSGVELAAMFVARLVLTVDGGFLASGMNQ